MLRLTVVILAATLTALAPAETGSLPVSVLRLKPQVDLEADTLTLGDLLNFSEADPELHRRLAATPFDPDLRPPVRTEISYRRIEARLRELGVNPGRVLLRGAAACRVSLAPPPAGPVATEALRSLPAEASGKGLTLADVLRNHIQADLSELGGKAEVEFERAGSPFLELTSDKWEFVIRARGRSRLGLREFHVVLRQDGRTQRTVTLYARVRLSRPVVVAREPLNIGSFVRFEQIGLEPRIFERVEDLGCTDPAAVVGQRVRRFVPAGQMVRPDDLKPVDMVQRSRPVTVIGCGKNVQVRLTGVALDSGRFGETVRVRLGQNRHDRRIVRGVVAGLATVRLDEE